MKMKFIFIKLAFVFLCSHVIDANNTSLTQLRDELIEYFENYLTVQDMRIEKLEKQCSETSKPQETKGILGLNKI
jgi:hypothetical protein